MKKILTVAMLALIALVSQHLYFQSLTKKERFSGYVQGLTEARNTNNHFVSLLFSYPLSYEHKEAVAIFLNSGSNIHSLLVKDAISISGNTEFSLQATQPAVYTQQKSRELVAEFYNKFPTFSSNIVRPNR